MGVRGLGRLFNVVPIAAGRGLSMVDASGITFITTGADTFTLTLADTFAGTYNNTGLTTLAGVVDVYKNAAANGSAAWVKDNALIANNTIVTTVTTAFYIGADQLPDTRVYVKLSAAAAGLVTAVYHDLLTQRDPANLAIPSA